MRSRLRDALKRSRAVIIATMLLRNAAMGASARLRPNRPVRLGARHEGFSLEESITYIDWVVDDYRRHGRLDQESLAGAAVLELGPGDNLGVALRLLGLGAKRVVSLDRFVTRRDPEQQRRINGALAERMTGAERERIAGLLDDRDAIRPDQRRLTLIEGTGIEDAPAALGAGAFDLLVSRAVLAHVYDLDAAFDAMETVLAPAGQMVHKVDLSDHRLFSDAGHNPLTFLTIPDRIYDRMRRHTGLTNRRVADYYRARLASWPDSELLATKLLGAAGDLPEPLPFERVPATLGADARGLIADIRPRLLKRYKELPDEDLAVSGAFMRVSRSRTVRPPR